MGPADGDDRQQLAKHYLAAQSGPMACERMVDALEEIDGAQRSWPKPGLGSRGIGWCLCTLRTAVKRYKDSRPGSHNRPEFQHHRYPEVSLEDMQDRVNRIKKLLNISEDLNVESVFDKFFRISA